MSAELLKRTSPRVDRRRAAMNMAAGMLWNLPGAFDIACILGFKYSLRSVLFHDVSDTETPFTKGLGCTTTRKDFAAALKFLTKHYTPVSFQDVLNSVNGSPLPPRPVLVTFDDAYASVSEFAAPLCSKFGVPALFFINASCLDNQQLALDNLVCFVANICGLEKVNAAIRSIKSMAYSKVHSPTEVFSQFLPATSALDRQVFRSALIESARLSETELARAASLYLSSGQVRELARFNFELGNHTFSHINCRTLSAQEFSSEIDRNKNVLESLSRTNVRSFSVPYGSSADLTQDLVQHLHNEGYKAIFLAEGGANTPRTSLMRFNRVSIKANTDSAFFSEIEILPRLRSIRDELVATS